MTTEVAYTAKGRVEYSITGAGMPVVFLHGGHSNCNETLFHKGFDTRTFSLITPSRPGYGNTPLSDGRSPREAAELVVSLLDKLDVPQATVVGISAGGLTAIECAAHFPDRVRKLVLISAVTKRWMTDSDANYRKGKKLFSPRNESYTWALFRFMYSLMPTLMAKTMFKELSKVRPPKISRDEVLELHSMIRLQRSNDGFVNDLDQDIGPDTLGKIACDTLILHSSNDNSVSIDHAHHARAMIKNSVLNDYDNKWGHLIWLGQESSIPIKDTIDFIMND
jgi:pimeloyl-ACP methyl ester carboxylesterase